MFSKQPNGVKQPPLQYLFQGYEGALGASKVNDRQGKCQLINKVLASTKTKKVPTVDKDGCVLCPDCKTRVRTGNGGVQNFIQRHRGTAQCATNRKKKQTQDKLERQKENVMKWFQPRAPIVPPTVTAPALVKPAHLSATSTSTWTSPPILTGCPLGVALLRKFRARVEGLPQEVGQADENHPLAPFSGDPVGCVMDGEDAWEKFDGPLNTILQRPPEELRDLVRIGEKGLIGLCRLLEYLVMHHQLTGHLFEGKLERLICAIDKV